MSKPNLNEATQKQLMKVTQIGPILSARLLSARLILPNSEFTSWKQVAQVSELGPNRLQNLQTEFDIQVKVEDQRVKVEDQSQRAKLKIDVQVKVEDQREEQVKVEGQQSRRPELACQVQQEEHVERTIETQDSNVEIHIKVQSKASN